MVELDLNAVEEYLTLGTTLNRKTFEKDVLYTIKNGLKYNGVIGKPSIDRIIKAYEDSIIEVCEGKKNILLQLSGGKDSRLIAAILKKNHIDFTACTYGEYGSLDVFIAKMVAKQLGKKIWIFRDIKEIFNLKSAIASVKATHGIRFYDGSLMQHHSRYFFRQFDLVLEGYQANLIFDSMCVKNYPYDTGLYALKHQYVFMDCCEDSKHIFARLSKHYYNRLLEVLWLDEINKARALDGNAWRSWGINNMPVVNQEVVDAVFAFPYKERNNIQLTQKMMKKINIPLWLIPLSSYGGLPLAAPYRMHRRLYDRAPITLPKWKFTNPTKSLQYNTECFADYIETLPGFIDTLPIFKKDKCLELLKTSVLFRDRLMNVKMWCENEIY